MEYKFNDEMQLEYVNENQIRCTLTKNILQERNLNILELASGTKNAKKLFGDIMKSAYAFFNFDAENVPLQIEALPLDVNTTILIITKTEDFVPSTIS